MTTESQAVASTPRWAGILVALLLLSAMCAASGWWFWSYLHQPSQAELMPVPGEDVFVRGISVQPSRPPSDVSRLPNGGWRIVAGEVILNASVHPQTRQWTFQLNYRKPDLMTPEQSAALVARFRLTNDPAFARSLKVTEEQVKRLREVPAGTGMVVSQADMEKVKAAWDRYTAAMQPDNLKSLQEVLREVGQSSLQPTRQAIAQRVEQIQSILTPEQIAPFKQ